METIENKVDLVLCSRCLSKYGISEKNKEPGICEDCGNHSNFCAKVRVPVKILKTECTLNIGQNRILAPFCGQCSINCSELPSLHWLRDGGIPPLGAGWEVCQVPCVICGAEDVYCVYGVIQISRYNYPHETPKK